MPIGPAYDPSESVFANLFHPSETTSWAPQAPCVQCCSRHQGTLLDQRGPVRLPTL